MSQHPWRIVQGVAMRVMVHGVEAHGVVMHRVEVHCGTGVRT